MLHRFQNCPQSSTQRRLDNGVYINARLRAKRNLCLAVEVKLLWAFRTPALIRLGEKFLHEKAVSVMWDSGSSRGAYLGLYVGPNLPPLVRVPIEGLHTHEQVSGV